MGQRSFVSFDECKAKIPLPEVLQVLGIADRFKERNRTLVGCCPFPSHVHGPSPNSEQFKINLVEGVWLWRCWGDCKAAGNVIQFVMRMTGLSAEHVRFWFAEHFSDRLSQGRGREESKSPRASPAEAAELKKEAGEVLVKPQPANVNESESKVAAEATEYKPIRFRLQVDSNVPYLQKRGIEEETAKRFGIGLASRGMMSGYVVAPVWDCPRRDFPAGYIGRWPGEDYNADQGRPRYKLPGSFPKQRYLFGINEALEGTERQPLIVVESFFGAMHCVQHGAPATIATLGSSLSDEQADMLVRTGRPIVLMFDGDESGRAGMEAAAAKLLPQTFVRTIRLDDGRQPDQLDSTEIESVLSFTL